MQEEGGGEYGKKGANATKGERGSGVLSFSPVPTVSLGAMDL